MYFLQIIWNEEKTRQMAEKNSVKKKCSGRKKQNLKKSNWQKFDMIKRKLLSVAFFDTCIFVDWAFIISFIWFFHEMWIIFAFKKNKWLKQLYIQTYRHILTKDVTTMKISGYDYLIVHINIFPTPPYIKQCSENSKKYLVLSKIYFSISYRKTIRINSS